MPDAPLGFVEREELGELRAALLPSGRGAVAITGGGGGLGLYGQGGIGKTVLAAALARDFQLRRHFPDEVHWVSLGERPDPLGAQIDLLGRLSVSTGGIRTSRLIARCDREGLAADPRAQPAPHRRSPRPAAGQHPDADGL